MAQQTHMTLSRNAGAALVVVSAVVFSTAGSFTNGVAADAWGIIFWRGLAAAGFTFAYLAMTGALIAEIRCFGTPAILATVLMAMGTAAFIPAFKLSSVANVVLIYASAPFFAAGLSWIVVGEAPSRRVIVASLAAFGGVLVIVAGSLGTPNLLGDGLALVMTVMMAGVMVVYRARPKTTAALPAALSSVVLLPIALVVGQPFLTPGSDQPVLVVFGLVFAIASVTLSEGARRLPSGETALLSALEVPLAPILAWLILAETPSVQVLAGGAIIMVAVIWSQVNGESRKVKRTTAKRAEATS